MDSFGLMYPLIPGYKGGLGFGLVCRLGLGLGGTLAIIGGGEKEPTRGRSATHQCRPHRVCTVG